ncbi:hypothetical protein ACF0H5_020895 [Mactra antiquata]
MENPLYYFMTHYILLHVNTVHELVKDVLFFFKGLIIRKMEASEPFVEKEEPQTERNTKYHSLGLMIISSVLGITLLVLAIYWRQIRLKELDPQESVICVPVSSLVGIADLAELAGGETFERLDTSGERVLCGKISVLLNLMVKKSVTKWDKDGDSGDFLMTLEGCTTEVCERPSGYLGGIDFEAMDRDKSGVVQWRTSSMSLKGGIKYKEGSFIIQKTGYYYITTQLKFGNPQSAKLLFESFPVESDGDNETFRHYVYKRSDGIETSEKILEGARIICDSPNENIEATSTVGAAFYLGKGDEFFVTTSNPYILLDGDESNQFSVYYI